MQAGINGAISGAIMGGVAGFAGAMGWSPGGFNSVIAHAIGGGVNSVVQGEEFAPGAMSAGFMDGLTPRIENISGTDGTAIAKRVVASAVVGGTTSKLGGQKFANGADTFGFMRLFGESALKMQQSMITQSKLDPRNASKVSVGFNGSGFGLGGGRYDPDNPFGPPSPLGGDQGGPGSFFGSPYAPGSLRDYVVEAYGGPHDFLNSGYWYDDVGDIRRGMSNFSRGFGELLNYTNVVVATPFVAASVGLIYGDPVAESRIAGGW